MHQPTAFFEQMPKKFYALFWLKKSKGQIILHLSKVL